MSAFDFSDPDELRKLVTDITSAKVDAPEPAPAPNPSKISMEENRYVVPKEVRENPAAATVAPTDSEPDRYAAGFKARLDDYMNQTRGLNLDGPDFERGLRQVWQDPQKPADPGRKLGFDAGLTQYDLNQAQQHADRVARRALQGRASSELAAAMGGFKADNSFWDAKEKLGEREIDNVLRGRKGAEESLAFKGSQNKAMDDDEARDPKSAKNKAYRESLVRTAPEYFSAIPRDVFDQITVGDSEYIFKPMQLKEQIDARKEEATIRQQTALQKGKEEVDPDSPGNVSMRAILKAAYPAEVANIPGFDTLTGKAAQEALKTFTAIGGQKVTMRGQDKSAEEKAKDRAARATSDAKRFDTRRESFNYKMAQNAVNDWVPVSPNTPPLLPKQKEQVSEQITARNVVKKITGEMQEIIEKNDGHILNPADEDYTRFVELLQELKPQITTAGGYGNFTVAHEKLVEKLVAHPDELLNYINNGRISTQLESLAHGVDMSLAQRQKDLGYRWRNDGEDANLSHQQPQATQHVNTPKPGGPPALPKVGTRKVASNNKTYEFVGPTARDWKEVQ